HFVSLRCPHPPRPPRFPYTTLFRSKCHEAGMEQIGIEHAGFDTLRAYNFEKNRSKSGGQQVTFALLSIDDARFLIRVHPNNIIEDRKSTRLNSSHVKISYAVFCLKK